MLLEMEHTQDAGIFRGDTRSYWRRQRNTGEIRIREGEVRIIVGEVGIQEGGRGKWGYKNGEMRILEEGSRDTRGGKREVGIQE